MKAKGIRIVQIYDRIEAQREVECMSEQINHVPHLTTQSNQPLIGIFLKQNDHDVVQYFTEEGQADSANSERAVQRALGLAGSWSDLDWEEVERELHRIRHESQPTPPISL